MVDQVSTYGSGWLKYDNKNAKVIENQKHGQAMTNTAQRKQRAESNTNALNSFRELLQDDNYDKEIQIFVTDRTVDGSTQSKQAGQTYDLGDIFTQLAAEGYIKDNDGSGFTMANAKSLGAAVAAANDKDSPFHKFFTRSKDSRSFIVNRELALQFIEAAGYSREKAPVTPPKKEEPKPVEPPKKEEPKPVEPPKKEEPKPAVQVEAHGNEKYSNIGLENTKQIIIDGFVQGGAISEGDKVCLDFKGNLKPDDKGDYYKKGKIALKVTDDPNVDPHKLPEKEGNKLRYKIDKDGNVYVKKTGLFNRIFTKYQKVGHSDYTPNKEAAQEVEE